MTQYPNSSIYLTYKSRIEAESRARKAYRFLNILLAWYSFWVIALSVLDLKASEGTQHGVLIVILSVFVFGLSLVVPWLALDELAGRHRECYLHLQKLYAAERSAEAKGAEYNDILKNYPNHSDRDWDKMMVKAANRNKKLFDKDGEIIATKIQYRNTFLHDASDVIFAALALMLPFIILNALR